MENNYIAMCVQTSYIVLDYQNFPHKYKESISFCASLVLNKPLKTHAIFVTIVILKIKTE